MGQSCRFVHTCAAMEKYRKGLVSKGQFGTPGKRIQQAGKLDESAVVKFLIKDIEEEFSVEANLDSRALAAVLQKVIPSRLLRARMYKCGRRCDSSCTASFHCH